MANLREKLKQMITKNPRKEKKVPMLGEYIREQNKKKSTDELLGILERDYPKGFIFKTDEGKFNYLPNQEGLKEREFITKKLRTELH